MPEAPTDKPDAAAIRNLVLVCIGLTSVFVAQTMLLLAVPLRALDMGASPSMVGLVLAAPYLLPLAFAIPLGGVVTRAGAQKVTLLGACGMLAGPWLTLLIPDLAGLLATQLTIGLAHVVMVIAAQSIVASLGRGRQLERYFGWYTMCLSGGQLIGPLLAGRLIDTQPMTSVFMVIGAIPLIAVASTLLFVGDSRRGHAAPSALLGYRAQAALLRDNIGVKMSIAVTVAVLFALGAHAAFLPVYLESIALSATAIGVLISLRAFCAMLIRPFMSTVIQALGGRSRTMVASVAAVALGMMWTGTTESVGLLAFYAVLVGLGSGVSQPLSMVVLAEHVATEQRASALGMRLMGNRGAQVLAPLLLGFIAEWLGFTLAFLACGAILLCLLTVVIRLMPGFDRVEREAA